MTQALVFLTILAIIVFLWMDATKAREFAIAVCRAACDKRGLQFLDETVHQTHWGLIWTKQGIRFRRMFVFDFSHDGAQRHSGCIILRGNQVEQLILDQAETDAVEIEQTPQTSEKDEDNVVPFKKPKK